LEQSQAMPNARGGSRRQRVPLVEVGALQQAFEELVRKMGEKVFEFGVYRSLARAQAANAHGLAANEQAIGTLSCLAPDGYLQFAQLKHALQGFACYNDTPFKADIWAGCVAERLLTLLCHWRRVSREPERLKQCLSKASKEDQAAVKRLVKLYQEPSSSEAPSKKTLQRERTDSSSVTLDSQGFPRMLRELGDDSCTDDEEKEEAEGEGEEELQECSQETPRAKPRGAAPQEPCGRLLRKAPEEDERANFLDSHRAAAHEAAGDVAQMRDVANKRVHKTIMKKNIPARQGAALHAPRAHWGRRRCGPQGLDPGSRHVRHGPELPSVRLQGGLQTEVARRLQPRHGGKGRQTAPGHHQSSAWRGSAGRGHQGGAHQTEGPVAAGVSRPANRGRLGTKPWQRSRSAAVFCQLASKRKTQPKCHGHKAKKLFHSGGSVAAYLQGLGTPAAWSS
jgi:hypothetical protein